MKSAIILLVCSLLLLGCSSKSPNSSSDERVESVNTTTDSDYCNDASTSELVDFCYKDRAFNNNDITSCVHITNLTIKDMCYRDLINYKKIEAPLCDEMVYSQEMQDFCYFQLGALGQENTSYCDKIHGVSYKDGCFEALGIELRDIALCERISVELDRKSNCMSSVAVAMNDTSICERIQTATDKQVCYQKVLGE